MVADIGIVGKIAAYLFVAVLFVLRLRSVFVGSDPVPQPARPRLRNNDGDPSADWLSTTDDGARAGTPPPHN